MSAVRGHRPSTWLVVVLCSSILAANGDQFRYKTIRFFGATASTPSALILAGDGSYYGVTEQGGSRNKGTLFRFDPVSRSHRTLVEFGSFYPSLDIEVGPTKLVETTTGELLIVAQELIPLSTGGSVFPTVILSLNKSGGDLRRVARFSVGEFVADSGQLLRASDGKVYGGTSGGENSGRVFVIETNRPTQLTNDIQLAPQFAPNFTPPMAFSDLWLLSVEGGVVYGAGCLANCDEELIFAWEPATGSIRELTRFGHHEVPTALTTGSDGFLYGTTFFGTFFGGESIPDNPFDPGTVFRLEKAGGISQVLVDSGQLQASAKSAAGSYPVSLITGGDGYLYGTTSGGGEFRGGTLFRVRQTNISTNTEFKILMALGGPGASVETRSSTLILNGDSLVGLTDSGGYFGRGTLWEYLRSAADSPFHVLFNFGYSGNDPVNLSPLVEGRDGALYGTSVFGGRNGDGTLFRFDPKLQELKVLQSFPIVGIYGGSPEFPPTFTTNGSIVGTLGAGIFRLPDVLSDHGTEIFPDKLIAPSTGELDGGLLLTQAGEIIAGLSTTSPSVQYKNVTLFKISESLDPTTFRTFPRFNIKTNELLTAQTLVEGRDGHIYGIAYHFDLEFLLGPPRPRFDTSIFFSFDPSGSAEALSRLELKDPDRRLLQLGPPLEVRPGEFWCATTSGITNKGAIVRIVMDGRSPEVLFQFDASPGQDPEAPSRLVRGRDGWIYWTTATRGTNVNLTVLTVFRLDATGTHFEEVFSSSDEAGSVLTALVQACDGAFYGVLKRPQGTDEMFALMPPNQPPRLDLEAIVPDRAFRGRPYLYKFPLNAISNAEPCQEVTVSLYFLPDGLSFDPTNRWIVGTPLTTGTFRLYLNVVDEGEPRESAQGEFDLEVRDVDTPQVLFGDTHPPPVSEGDGNVTLTVFKAGFAPAKVNVTIESGTATAGRDFEAQLPFSLEFGTGPSQTNITVQIFDNFVEESNRTFTVKLEPVGTNVVVTEPVATVTIADNDAGVGTSPLLQRVFASLATGRLQVKLDPPGVSAWRFEWESVWRMNDVIVSNLAPAEYVLAFQPVRDLAAPTNATLRVTNDMTTLASFSYQRTNPPTGALSVSFEPPVPPGAGWRVMGAEARDFRENGDTWTNLATGIHLIEFNMVLDWTTPETTPVLVLPGGSSVTSSFTTRYLPSAECPRDDVSKPHVLSRAELGGAEPFYQPNGQLKSPLGFGSGVAVRERVVLTAAHVVYDPKELTGVGDIRWRWFRRIGADEPEPLTPRGWYIHAGYEEIAKRDGTKELTLDSAPLDAAALFFMEPAARGAFSGYLINTNRAAAEWFLGKSETFLAGYPISGANCGIKAGTLHATSRATYAFQRLIDGVFVSPDFLSFEGNSGGPVYARAGDANFYPAGIYLGTLSDELPPHLPRSVVRVIDTNVVDLINRAASSANTGTNFLGGGVSFTVQEGIQSGSAVTLTVYLFPEEVRSMGAKWRIREVTNDVWRVSGSKRISSAEETSTLEFLCVPGYLSPTNFPFSLPRGQSAVAEAHYVPVELSLSVVNIAEGMRLRGTPGATVLLQFKPNLSMASGWKPIQTNTLGESTLIVKPSQWSGPSNGFYRVMSICPP